MIKSALAACCTKCGAYEFAAQISLAHMEEHLRNIGWKLHKDGYVTQRWDAAHYCPKCVKAAGPAIANSAPKEHIGFINDPAT